MAAHTARLASRCALSHVRGKTPPFRCYVTKFLRKAGAKQAQKALGAHPDTLAPTAKGAETSKRVLINLAQVVAGLAELRNAYGPDHGRSRATGLGPCHAHLATGAATTYCRFLLETLDARRRDAQ